MKWAHLGITEGLRFRTCKLRQASGQAAGRWGELGPCRGRSSSPGGRPPGGGQGGSCPGLQLAEGTPRPQQAGGQELRRPPPAPLLGFLPRFRWGFPYFHTIRPHFSLFCFQWWCWSGDIGPPETSFKYRRTTLLKYILKVSQAQHIKSSQSSRLW